MPMIGLCCSGRRRRCGALLLPVALILLSACGGEASDNDAQTVEAVSAQTAPSATAGRAPGLDFRPTPLEQLAGMAPLIVVGRIVTVYEAHFALAVEDTLAGGVDNDVIPVEKGQYPAFLAVEHAPYEAGQRYVLFLRPAQTASRERRWRIMGLPLTGELAADSRFVYFDSYTIEGFDFAEWTVHGVRKMTQRIELALFRQAVQRYRACFPWSREARGNNGGKKRRWVPSRVCDMAAVNDLRHNNRLYDHLVGKTLRQTEHP